MVSTRFVDMFIRTADGSPLVAVEVTNPIGLNEERAVEQHRHLVERGYAGSARFFLLVSQDQGFFWDHRLPGGTSGPPVVRFNMAPVIERYLPDGSIGPRLESSTLDLLVIPWLYDLIDGMSDRGVEPEATLDQAGVLDELVGKAATLDVEP